MLRDKISYRRYKLHDRRERMFGIVIYTDKEQPTLDIYTGQTVHVWIWRKW